MNDRWYPSNQVAEAIADMKRNLDIIEYNNAWLHVCDRADLSLILMRVSKLIKVGEIAAVYNSTERNRK